MMKIHRHRHGSPFLASACVAAGLFLFTQARAEDKMHLTAALDATPLAGKLGDLRKAILVSATALRQDLQAIKEPVQANTEAVKSLEKRLDDLEANLNQSLARIELLLQKPSGYEYNILRTASARQANELGAAGWELVTTARDEWLIFRRPLFKKRAAAKKKTAK